MIKNEGKLILSWNSTSGLKLEDSSTLSDWGEVEDVSGQDSYEIDSSNGGSRFFRLSKRPPEESGD